MISMIKNAKNNWHYWRKNYFQSLYDCCLDPNIKVKLKQKMEYHQSKINDVL